MGHQGVVVAVGVAVLVHSFARHHTAVAVDEAPDLGKSSSAAFEAAHDRNPLVQAESVTAPAGPIGIARVDQAVGVLGVLTAM